MKNKITLPQGALRSEQPGARPTSKTLRSRPFPKGKSPPQENKLTTRSVVNKFTPSCTPHLYFVREKRCKAHAAPQTKNSQYLHSRQKYQLSFPSLSRLRNHFPQHLVSHNFTKEIKLFSNRSAKTKVHRVYLCICFPQNLSRRNPSL